MNDDQHHHDGLILLAFVIGAIVGTVVLLSWLDGAVVWR